MIAHTRRVMAKRWRELSAVVALYAAATIAGLVPPRMLGSIVTAVQHGTTARTIDLYAAVIAVALIAQSVLIRFGSLAGAKLGEALLATFREDFIAGVLGLPLSTVERAGSGDLMTRSSRDINALSQTTRQGVPAMLTAALAVTLTIGAIAVDNPVLVAPCLIVVPPIWAVARWYLRRATAGYLRESASWGVMTDSLAETVEGARTVEALRLAPVRRQRADADITDCFAAEMYTLRLRTVFMPAAEATYILPLAGVLSFGGIAYLNGWCTLGQVTAAALYARALVTPMEQLIDWLDHLQLGRGLAGPAAWPGPGTRRPAARIGGPAPTTGCEPPRSATLTCPGTTCCIESAWTSRPASGSRSSGRAARASRRSGGLLAGISGPDSGEISVGTVPLIELPLDDLRGQIALVTQEHHIFQGTLGENITLGQPDASAEAVRAALRAVDALDWALALPDGLATAVGAGGLALSAPQAQQIALARLVLANPHTLILDEATSLLDPRSARHLEQSLSAVLDGRTVVAIAHRLHTAHDADRVIVMEDGRISESGPHRDLIKADGAYAALWRSWHGKSPNQQRRDRLSQHEIPQDPVHNPVDNSSTTASRGG